MLAKDMEILAWNLKGWSISLSTVAWKFCRWYSFAKAENSSHQFIFGTRWPRFGHYSALQGASTRRIEKKNFGVRTYVQSVPLIQAIHTTTIACSLSSLLWLLIQVVHFEEFRFERISLVQNARRWSVFSRRSRLIWPDWTWCWQVFQRSLRLKYLNLTPVAIFLRARMMSLASIPIAVSSRRHHGLCSLVWWRTGQIL